METNLFDDMNMSGNQSATTTPTPYENHYNFADDSTSASYIPRMARIVPHASTVHTIFIKKITYPMTSRQAELWILERAEDGLENWRPVETFLGNLQLTQDHRVLRATANQWRLHYDVPPMSASTTSPLHPVLPHPEHSNVHFGQPVSTIPDHTYILQSCWGRSAQHHSQGSPISPYWPPWCSTPPSSPSRTPTRMTTTYPLTSAPTIYTPGNTQHDKNGMTDMSESSV